MRRRVSPRSVRRRRHDMGCYVWWVLIGWLLLWCTNSIICELLCVTSQAKCHVKNVIPQRSTCSNNKVIWCRCAKLKVTKANLVRSYSCCRHSCSRLSGTFSRRPKRRSFATYLGSLHQDVRARISLKNTHHFLDGIMLQYLTGEVVTVGFVLRRKRGYCGLHSPAFIFPIVVLGIGWLMRASWGWSVERGCPALITISRQ